MQLMNFSKNFEIGGLIGEDVFSSKNLFDGKALSKKVAGCKNNRLFQGRIAVGADADLVLWDASVRWKLSSAERQSSVDASLYDGLTIHAQVKTFTRS